jgi:UDP-N-acetylglucosamine 1-carboxyvinyltransferase
MSQNSFVVNGLGGKKVLRGEIAVRGAKNAILKAQAATILFEDEVPMHNIPAIEDVTNMQELLKGLQGGNTTLKDDIARRIRASIGLTGPVLARYGRVSFPHPGGDVIGPRPINLFLEGFEKMGATVSLDGDTYTVSGKLHGAEISFNPISVMATETLMMAATLAEGTTTLRNAAREPEIEHLAQYLNTCGANIEGAGTSTITIVGGGLLRANGNPYVTPPDRIETGTFVLLGALAAEKIKITNCNPAHIGALLEMLKNSGVAITIGADYIEVEGCTAPRSFDVVTEEYPGFATDLQPPMVVYLTQAAGTSALTESIWKGRLAYTADLTRMGAKIELTDSQHARITGPTPLRAAELRSPDIRAGLAFLMAAAIAEGTSTIDNVYHIDRGYEHIEERLQKLGLNIKRQQA